MSRLDDDFDFNAGKHHKTRAFGQLWMGPLQATGADNRVLEVSINEMQFKNSVEAKRYMDLQRKKYANPRQLCNGRRMKMISQGDDR